MVWLLLRINYWHKTMRKIFQLFLIIFLTKHLHAGKFDGLSLAAGIGTNVASFKELPTNDLAPRIGGNGKLYAGICKNLLELVFIGTEFFGEYRFFAPHLTSLQPTTQTGPQFGGYLKAGLRVSDNLLVYALYGSQTNAIKVQNALTKLFEENQETWSTIVGTGLEYVLGLSIAVRVEGTYAPDIHFKLQEIPNLEYSSNFLSINIGIVVYL